MAFETDFMHVLVSITQFSNISMKEELSFTKLTNKILIYKSYTSNINLSWWTGGWPWNLPWINKSILPFEVSENIIHYNISWSYGWSVRNLIGPRHKYSGSSKVGSNWVTLASISEFLRPVFSTFLLGDPICADNWTSKCYIFLILFQSGLFVSKTDIRGVFGSKSSTQKSAHYAGDYSTRGVTLDARVSR